MAGKGKPVQVRKAIATLGCGCKVIEAGYISQSGSVLYNTIEYCPKHGTAPELYEALGTIKRTAESSGPEAYLQNALKIIARIAREAKAKADGRTP